ncbi:MAG TPA: oligosaccharide flippase family protein, partial [Herpetosiphonaceae bacterium]
MTKGQPSLSQQVWSATVWNTLLFPARFLVGIVASVIYYQTLSLEQVGLLFLLTTMASTIGLWADLGVERALPRFIPEIEQSEGKRGVRRFMNRMIRLKLGILAALILALNLLGGPLTGYMSESQRETVADRQTQLAALPADAGHAKARADLAAQLAADEALVSQIEQDGRLFLGVVSALLVLGALFDVYMQFLTAYFKQRAWNLITLATTLLQPILVTIFLLLGWGVNGVLLGMVLTPLASVALAAWQARRASGELEDKPGSGAPPEDLPRRFARFAGVSYLMQVSTWLYDIQFVLVFAAALLNSTEIALLGFAYKFAKDYLGYVWTPLGGVMTPLLTRIKARRDPAALREAHASLTRMIWLIVVPAGVGLALLTPRMLQALYPKYQETAALIIIFIAFTFAESLLSVPHNVLMVYEHYKAVIWSRVAALLVIPLVYLLLPRFGLVGVALAVGLVRVGSRLITV